MGITCDLAKIPVAHCSAETVCTHTLHLSKSACSQQHHIVVRVSSTNAVGTGLPTTSTVGMCTCVLFLILLCVASYGYSIIIIILLFRIYEYICFGEFQQRVHLFHL